jgi:hypothetical protein
MTTHPHGTQDEGHWRTISQPLAQAVRDKTKGRPDLFIAGSAVTGKSFADKPGRPKGTAFDEHSDFDMGLASDALYEHVKRTNPAQLSKDHGPAKTRALKAKDLRKLKLNDIAEGVSHLSKESGRKVSLAIFESDSARVANAGREHITREHSPSPTRRASAASSSSASPSAPGPGPGPRSNDNASGPGTRNKF